MQQDREPTEEVAERLALESHPLAAHHAAATETWEPQEIDLIGLDTRGAELTLAMSLHPMIDTLNVRWGRMGDLLTGCLKV